MKTKNDFVGFFCELKDLSGRHVDTVWVEPLADDDYIVSDGPNGEPIDIDECWESSIEAAIKRYIERT